jgi:transcription termination/antitermination protein NusG
MSDTEINDITDTTDTAPTPDEASAAPDEAAPEHDEASAAPDEAAPERDEAAEPEATAPEHDEPETAPEVEDELDEIVDASDDDVLTADGEEHATDVAPAEAAGEADAAGGEPTAVDDPGAPDEDVTTDDRGVESAEGGSAEGAVSTEADDGASSEAVSEDELLAEAPVVDNPFTRPGRWFVVHTQSGYEKKVKQNLEARIHSMNAEEAVYEVVIPMEDYVDFKNGKRVVNQRKMFPGYLLVRAELDDTAWFVIRNTPGVTGFVGQGAKPSPLPRRDVEAFLMPKGGEEQVASRAKPRLEYELGETVRVKEGPFADFSGEVIELNEDQLKLKVLVNIFGRETPVELEFSKVAKL